MHDTPDNLDKPRPASAPVCVVELNDTTRRLAPQVLSALQAQSQQALASLASHPKGATISGGSLRVKIINDAAMSAAHAQHSGVDGPTDILTFDLRENPTDPLDTDLLIDLDEAERQAKARQHAAQSELLLYIIHGVLHCLGFDDHNDRDFEEMHALEDQTLTAIGVGSIFARHSVESRPSQERQI